MKELETKECYDIEEPSLLPESTRQTDIPPWLSNEWESVTITQSESLMGIQADNQTISNEQISIKSQPIDKNPQTHFVKMFSVKPWDVLIAPVCKMEHTTIKQDNSEAWIWVGQPAIEG